MTIGFALQGTTSRNVRRQAMRARSARKWRKVLTVYAVCWTIGIGLLLHLCGSVASADTQYRTYTVQPGDTLWSIARQVNPTDDTRVVVNQLEHINHLTSTDLVAGETLHIPSN